MTAGPSNTRDIVQPHNQPKTSQSEPGAGLGPEVYPAPQISRRQGYVVTHRHERPILAVLQNFCRAAWTIRAYYRTATGQSLGDHITKSLPGRRENKDRSSRHVSEGILHESWQCYVIRDAESASKRISRYVEQSRYLIQESYRPSSDPRPFLQQSRDAIIGMQDYRRC